MQLSLQELQSGEKVYIPIDPRDWRVVLEGTFSGTEGEAMFFQASRRSKDGGKTWEDSPNRRHGIYCTLWSTPEEACSYSRGLIARRRSQLSMRLPDVWRPFRRSTPANAAYEKGRRS